MANPKDLDPRIGYHEPSGKRVFPQQYVNGRPFIQGARSNAPTVAYIAPEVPERYFVFVQPGVAAIEETVRADLMASIASITPKPKKPSARSVPPPLPEDASDSEDDE